MSKQTAVFNYCRDANGEVGFILDGANDERLNASISGKLLAHDLLEHMTGPGNIGDTADELLAFGAICYIRGQEYSAYTLGAFDLMTVFEEWDSEPIEHPARVDVDEDGTQFLAAVVRTLRRQTQGKPSAVQFCRAAARLLCAGWHEAQQRYGTRNEANALFHAVESACDNARSHGDSADGDGECCLVVEYDPDRQTATAELRFVDELV